MKKGIKRAWCKRKLRQLFTVLTSSNNARVESTSKTLQLNKTSILCSTILLTIVTVRPASAMTPVILVGNNASDVTAKAEKACTLLCKVALTLGKFSNTKEGRTAVVWAAWMVATKTAQVTSMIAVPSLGTVALTIAFICSAAYSIETLIGSDTFVGADFLNYANKWCVKGFSILGVSAILPKGKIEYAIKLLESLKAMG